MYFAKKYASMDISIEGISLLNRILVDIPDVVTFSVADIVRAKGITIITPDSAYGFVDLINESESNIDYMKVVQVQDFLKNYDFAKTTVPATNILSRDNFRNLNMALTEKGRQLKRSGSYEAYTAHIIQETDQLKRLDWVLHFMAIHAVQGREINDSWIEIKKLHPTIHIEGNESFRQQMFDKLVAEKYLIPKDNGVYWITFDGVIFDENGGYQEAKRVSDARNAEDKNYRIRSEDTAKKLNDLTKYLAIGSFLLAGVEILKMFLDHYSHEYGSFWLSCSLFLFGIGAGMIIYQIIKHLSEKRE